MKLSRDYFDVVSPSFWLLKEDAVEWNPLEKTLALRELVTATLEGVQPTGIPSAEGLMLFFALFGEELKAFTYYVEAALEPAVVVRMVGDNWEDRLCKRSSDFRRLAQECTDLPHWKIALAQIVFENANRTDLRDSTSLEDQVEYWNQRVGKLNPLVASERFCVALLEVLGGPQFFSRELIEARLAAGINALPLAPVEAVVEEEGGLAAWLRVLREESEDTQLIAALTERLVPVFSLKGQMKRPQDLPLGGYSDLSNRGSLDRLLPSELAHDNETLTVRIAMGEAMYLRREAPQVADHPVRLVLLDDGVRGWGVQRLFLFSSLLALLAARSDGEEHRGYRLMTGGSNGRIRRILLDSPSLLLREAGALGVSCHAGSGLGALMAEVAGQEGEVECYVLTTEQAARDPEFRTQLRSVLSLHPVLLVTVGREGALKVTRHSAAGERVLQSVGLEVQDVLAEFKEPEPEVSKAPSVPEHLPEFYQQYPFPLRTALHLPSVCAMGGEHYLGRNGEGDLFYWDDQDHHGRVLLREALPVRPRIRFGHRMPQSLCAVLEMNEQLRFLRVDLRNGAAVWTPFRHADTGEWKPQRFHRDAGVLYAIGVGRAECYDLNGQPLTSITIPHNWHCESGTYFRDAGHELYQLVYTARGMRFDKLPAELGPLRVDPYQEASTLGNELAISARPLRNISKAVFYPGFPRFRLGLVTPRGRLFALTYEEGRFFIRDRECSFQSGGQECVAGVGDADADGILRMGKWEDGSRIWIDRRGFLHLSPSDPNLGQLSLTLRQGELSAWHTSHGFRGKPADLCIASLKTADDELGEYLQAVQTAVTARSRGEFSI